MIHIYPNRLKKKTVFCTDLLAFVYLKSMINKKIMQELLTFL